LVAVKLSVGNTYGVKDIVNVEGDVDKCPICHAGIQPVDLRWDIILDAAGILERVFRCPRQSCQHLFIARYHQNRESGWFFLKACVPTELKPHSLPPELNQISKDFCEIYIEADNAEQLGLLLVCGPGYRKALEFLIKDYLTSEQTTDKAKKEIAESPLMACIRKYVTDARVKTTAERATWLGNDETHYIRKWEDKDLADMKKLIQLTCYWIQSEHLTKTAVVEMPQGKKTP
jgi:hypothetical protein